MTKGLDRTFTSVEAAQVAAGACRFLLRLGFALWTQATWAASALPPSDATFEREFDVTVESPVPDWPQSGQAPKNAPNVVLILLDDIGFGDTATFGGPAQTPA